MRRMTAEGHPREGGGPVSNWLAKVPPTLVATLLGLLLVSAAWVARTYSLPASAGTVQRILELRRDRSTDASAYAPFFGDPSIPRTLAAEARNATGSPLPRWERPYVSDHTTSTADVVVVWRGDERFPGWPKASVFRVRRSQGAWSIIDASVVASDVPVPEPRR